MFPIIYRAISESLGLFDTGPRVISLTLLGALITAVIVWFFRGIEGLKKHIFENIFIVFAGALGTWLLVFAWFLFYKVPQEIYADASHISVPEEKHPPKPPETAFNYYSKPPTVAANTVPFLFTVEGTFSQPDRGPDSSFWYEYDTDHGKTLSPVHILIALRVQNLQAFASLIESYTVEIDTDHGWVQLERMDMRFGTIYGGQETQACIMQQGWTGETLLMFC